MLCYLVIGSLIFLDEIFWKGGNVFDEMDGLVREMFC